MKTIFLAIIVLSAPAWSATHALDFELTQTGGEILIKNPNSNQIIRRCMLHPHVTDFTTSTDKIFLIFDGQTYAQVESLLSCPKEEPLKLRQPHKNVGILVDINKETNTYMAMDFVSTNPMTFLATIARIGSAKNLVTLPGAYPNNRRLKNHLRYAFQYSNPKISPDGRYATPTGEMDCTHDSFPGVWDLKTNRKVVYKSHGKSEARIRQLCKSLFIPKPRTAP